LVHPPYSQQYIYSSRTALDQRNNNVAVEQWSFDTASESDGGEDTKAPLGTMPPHTYTPPRGRGGDTKHTNKAPIPP
jgi:hypothetical protein